MCIIHRAEQIQKHEVCTTDAENRIQRNKIDDVCATYSGNYRAKGMVAYGGGETVRPPADVELAGVFFP